MNNKILTNIFLAASLILPIASLAAADLNGTITNFTNYALNIINFLLVIATLVFIWGIVKYVTAGGDASKISEARTYIIWGLIGLAVMGSVWVLTNWLIGVFNFGTENKIPKDKYLQG